MTELYIRKFYDLPWGLEYDGPARKAREDRGELWEGVADTRLVASDEIMQLMSEGKLKEIEATAYSKLYKRL